MAGTPKKDDLVSYQRNNATIGYAVVLKVDEVEALLRTLDGKTEMRVPRTDFRLLTPVTSEGAKRAHPGRS